MRPAPAVPAAQRLSFMNEVRRWHFCPAELLSPVKPAVSVVLYLGWRREHRAPSHQALACRPSPHARTWLASGSSENISMSEPYYVLLPWKRSETHTRETDISHNFRALPVTLIYP